MFDRRIKIRRFVVLGAAVAVTATAAPLGTADPAPLFVSHTQKAFPGRGEGLSGKDRAWLSTRQTPPRLGEGLNGIDRNWLTSSPNGGPVAAPSDGFEWGDAAAGAGIATAALIVLAGSALAIRRRYAPAH